MASLHVLDGEVIGGVPLSEELSGRYGTAVDLTPYTSSGNQYTIPSDGHIYVNAYNGNTGVVIINNTTIVGTTSTGGSNQYAFTTFVKKGMKVYVTQMVGSPNIKFLPFV